MSGHFEVRRQGRNNQVACYFFLSSSFSRFLLGLCLVEWLHKPTSIYILLQVQFRRYSNSVSPSMIPEDFRAVTTTTAQVPVVTGGTTIWAVVTLTWTPSPGLLVLYSRAGTSTSSIISKIGRFQSRAFKDKNIFLNLGRFFDLVIETSIEQ